MKDTQSGVALLPFLVFVIIFLGSGIILDDFYAFPASVAALCGVISAFLLPKASFQEKLKFFMKGCGEESIITMCIIYLLAGAFSAVSKATGSIDAVVFFGSQYFSAQYIPLGVFLMASFLSVSAGTSVGTIVALTPIVMGFAENTQTDINVVAASLLCGAMFGDNLSFISDTTIAATQSLGCQMKDKFRTNIMIAFPAAVIAAVIFIFLGGNSSSSVLENQVSGSPSIWLIVPYLLVIALSVLGVNVFLVLIVGVLLSGIIGISTGSLSWLDFANKIYEGFLGMNEIFLLALLTGGLAGIVENMGGITFLLNKAKQMMRGQKSAYFGMGFLVSLIDAAIANNTIAIVLSGKVAQNITEKYNLSPKFSASVLDIFSCIVQGILPYGAQILILIKLSENKVNYLEILQNAWYLYFLLFFVVLFIIIKSRKLNQNFIN
jgi:methionine transporter metT